MPATAGVKAFRLGARASMIDRKSTRLNSSHLVISYAVFCLKKKKISTTTFRINRRATRGSHTILQQPNKRLTMKLTLTDIKISNVYNKFSHNTMKKSKKTT